MLERVIDAKRHDLGGFEVGRVLPNGARRMVGPFVFFDHMGPADMRAPIPRTTDVRPHPHIGLSTVTYLFAGELTHRDSLGVEQVIEPGALNWMTAGSGITHSERFDGMREHGGRMDGIQAWVALPEESEDTRATFDHYGASLLPAFTSPGVRGRLIAGQAFGLQSPAKTHSPLFYAHVEADADARVAVPEDHAERAVYVAAGEVELAGQRYRAGQMLVFDAGGAPTLRAIQASRLMLLGGEPLGPRHVWWNFVSSSRERIEQAKADWLAGRFALPPLDNAEFIPLPDTPAPKPDPMS